MKLGLDGVKPSMSDCDDLTRHLQELSASKTIGLALINSQTSERFGWHPVQRFPLGSVAKLLLAVAVLQMVGDMPQGEKGEELSRLVWEAISLHSATATARLFDLAGGPEAVNLWLQSKGFADASVAANQRDPEANSATPRAIAHVLAGILDGRLLHGPVQELVLRALAEQTDPDGVLQGLPSGARWAHMTGGFQGVCNDVGILTRPDATLICCVFIQGDPHGDWEELREAVARIGQRIWAWC